MVHFAQLLDDQHQHDREVVGHDQVVELLHQRRLDRLSDPPLDIRDLALQPRHFFLLILVVLDFPQFRNFQTLILEQRVEEEFFSEFVASDFVFDSSTETFHFFEALQKILSLAFALIEDFEQDLVSLVFRIEFRAIVEQATAKRVFFVDHEFAEAVLAHFLFIFIETLKCPIDVHTNLLACLGNFFLLEGLLDHEHHRQSVRPHSDQFADSLRLGLIFFAVPDHQQHRHVFLLREAVNLSDQLPNPFSSLLSQVEEAHLNQDDVHQRLQSAQHAQVPGLSVHRQKAHRPRRVRVVVEVDVHAVLAQKQRARVLEFAEKELIQQPFELRLELR